MDTPDPCPAYIAGDLTEYLAITAGIVKGMPVGVLTFRLHDKSSHPLNLMITGQQLERLQEDIDFLLENSVSLKDGPSPEISLAELEATRAKLD